MPIPFAFIAIGAGAAALGLGKGAKAGVDQFKASKTNKQADQIAEAATQAAQLSRENSGKAIEALGRKKLWMLDNSVETFVGLFEQLHNVELGESVEMDELRKFHIDNQAIGELKQMSSTATAILGGVAGGAAAGALAAIGAYGGAMTLGTCATTGTAIATLSGAAATNATLAFLGGGALSAGGLGMAGGTMVLGGLVAGPALAVMGFVVGAKASANKDAAYTNLARAQEYAEEAWTVQVLCKAIRLRANLFERLLIKLDGVFQPSIEALAEVIRTHGTDYAQYGAKEKAAVAMNLSIAKAVKAVLDTPILTEDGTLTDESQAVVGPVENVIANALEA